MTSTVLLFLYPVFGFDVDSDNSCFTFTVFLTCTRLCHLYSRSSGLSPDKSPDNSLTVGWHTFWHLFWLLPTVILIWILAVHLAIFKKRHLISHISCNVVSDFDICSGKLCLTQLLAFDLAHVYLRTISDQSSSVSFPSLVQGRGPLRHTESLPICRVGGEAQGIDRAAWHRGRELA